MKASDFLIGELDPDPWALSRQHLRQDLVDQLRQGPLDSVDDLDAALGLTQLAREELIAYGTDGNIRLDDDGILSVLRTVRVVLKRLGIALDLPFRDFKGFYSYWKREDMSGSWAARRTYIEGVFDPIISKLDELDDARVSDGPAHGVDGQLKNLIFASSGPKPEIVLMDAINNVVQVTKHGEHCLFYDRPLTGTGLTWGELTAWWRDAAQQSDESDQAVARHLYGRLFASVKNNAAERKVFRTYCEQYRSDQAASRPALLPQVYLHYDPLTRRQRGSQPSALVRERMDFLLLLPRGVRVVIEVDGKQHYAEGDTASPRLYSEMVAEDRRLRLRGYEVYRFGGFELMQDSAPDMLRSFFEELLARYAS